VTNEKSKDQGTKFKAEAISEKLVKEVYEKVKEVLNIIRDEA
jgi:hypothetical protein